LTHGRCGGLTRRRLARPVLGHLAGGVLLGSPLGRHSSWGRCGCPTRGRHWLNCVVCWRRNWRRGSRRLVASPLLTGLLLGVAPTILCPLLLLLLVGGPRLRVGSSRCCCCRGVHGSSCRRCRRLGLLGWRWRRLGGGWGWLADAGVVFVAGLFVLLLERLDPLGPLELRPINPGHLVQPRHLLLAEQLQALGGRCG